MNQESVSIGRERAKYILAVALYGTIGMFLRYVHLPSELVAMCRGAIGSLFILAVLRVRRLRPDREAIRRNLKPLLISGVCLGLNWIFLFEAYIETTVAIASLCNYMAPLIVILLAPPILRERLDRRKLPCVAAAMLGIVLVSGVIGGSGANLPGVLLGLAAAFCFVIIVLCNRKMTGLAALDKSVVQLALSALTILPYFLLHNRGQALQADARSIGIVLMLGVLHTGFAYCLYFSGMATLPVQTVALLGYLEPVISVLCSAFFLGEPMTWMGWAGAALIIGAAAVSELLPEKPPEG